MEGWEITDDRVACTIAILSDLPVTFSASLIRQERTGVHAKYEIATPQVSVWDNGNIEKDDERGRLVNSFYRRCNSTTSAAYPKEQCKQDFDEFCKQVWTKWIGNLEPTLVAGDAEREPVAFVLEPYIVQDGGTLMFAPPKTLKSFLALALAVSIDAGVSRYWKVPQPRKVLFVNLERAGARLKQRLANVNQALGLSRQRPLRLLQARGRTLQNVIEPVRAYVKRESIECVIWDSLSRAGMGKLVADEVGNAVMDAVTSISPTWMMIAHTPRADTSHTFGSQMFDAAADVLLSVQAEHRTEGQPTGVRLHMTGENDVGARPPQILAFEFDKAGLTGIRPARPFEFPELAKDGQVDTRAEVIDYLSENGGAVAEEIAEALDVSRGRITHILKDHETFVKLAKQGKKQPYGLLSRDEVSI